MKIIHITASYKPAYIYGGPIMSVAKLCEGLLEQGIRSKEQGAKSKEQGLRNKEENIAENTERLGVHGEGLEKKNKKRKTKDEQGKTVNELIVFTTTANGKNELNVECGKSTLIDHVSVTYFKRLTKDHTHFSPALLWNLNKVLRQAQHDSREKLKGTKIKEQGVRNKEKGAKNQEQRIDEKLNWLEFSGKGLGGNDEQGVQSKEQEGENMNEESNREILREAQNDKKMVIHIHAWWNLVSIFSCFIAKWYQVPVVLSPRGMLTAYTQTNRNGFSKRLIHSLIGKKLLSYCHIHATSEQEKQEVLKIITPKSLTIIPNLVDLGKKIKEDGMKINEQGTKSKEGRFDENWEESKEQRPRIKEEGIKNQEQGEKNKEQGLRSKGETFKLIFLSRIEQKKGLEILFDALWQMEFDWLLTIAGSGEENYVDSLKLKVESIKLSGQISWVGQVENENKYRLLASQDLLVLTSYNENFANVVIESLSVGTPVLLSNKVGLADYVKNKNLGWITSLDTKSVGQTLQQSFDEHLVRKQIRSLAPSIIKEDFKDETLIKLYLDLYESISNDNL